MQKITMRHRLLSVLLCAVLLLSTFVTTAAVSVSAAEAEITEISAEVEAADEAADVDAAEEAAEIDEVEAAAMIDAAEEAADVDAAAEAAELAAAEEASALELAETGANALEIATSVAALSEEQLDVIDNSNDPIKVGSYVYNKLTAFTNSDVYAYTRAASGSYRAWTASGNMLNSAQNTAANSSQMFLVAKKAGYLNLTYTVTGNAVEVLYYKNGGVCSSTSYPNANNGNVDHGKNDFTGGNSNKAFPRIYVPQGQIIGFFFYSGKAYSGPANNGKATLANLSIKTPESLEEDYNNGDINKNTIVFNNVTDAQDPTAGGHISLTDGGESVASVDVYDGYPVTVYSVVDTASGYKDVWISKSSTYDYANYINCDDFNYFPTRYTLTYSGTGNNTLNYDVRFFDTDYFELYTDPDTGLKVETSGYYWRYGQLSGDDVLLSGARRKTGEGAYSFLKITAPDDQSGVLSFDYKLDFKANDPVTGTSGYYDGYGGIFLYRMGAEPANFTWEEVRWNAGSGVRMNTHIEGDFDNEFKDDEDHNYCYWQTRDEIIYHDSALHKYIGAVDWTPKSFTLFAGQTIYLAKYSFSSMSTNDVMYLRNVSFEQRDASTITFDQPTGGFMSTADSLDSTKAAQSSYTGFVGTVPEGASTFYAIPDIENGYVFEGLYTSPDYSAASLVEPDAGTTRAYSLVYPDSNTTYYPKFVHKDAIRLTVTRNTDYITNIRYRRVAVLRDENNIKISYDGAQTTWNASANNYIDLYPGDVYSFSYAVDDSCITNGIYLSYKNAQGETAYDHLLSKPSAVSEVIFDYDALAAAGAFDPVVDIRAAYSPYTPVEGYVAPAGANVEVSTRSVEGALVEQRKSSSTVDGGFYDFDSTNYLWYYDSVNREFVSGNSGIDGSYAFLKVKALTSGTLYLDCRIESAGNDYMYISYNGKDPTVNSGNWSTVFDGPTPGIMQTKYIEDPTAPLGLSLDTSWRTITKTVTAGETIRFAFNKNESGAAHGDCAWVRNVRVLTSPQSVTLETSDKDMGLVSLTGENYAKTVKQSNMAIGDTATAYAQALEGYRFVGWYDSFLMTTVSNDTEYTYTANEPSPTLTAVFAPEISGEVVATINGVGFDSINSAMEYAKNGNVVVLAADYTQKEDLTIPQGVTLLVPFDDDNTLYAEIPGYDPDGLGDSLSLYRKLTIDKNVTVTVNGAISLSAKHPSTTTGNKHYGAVTGPYSQIELSSGSKVILNNNADLFAWGFITGAGKVVANSGSEIYEIMQVNDWRGGSLTSAMYGNGVNQFPFNQYYVQNIESDVEYHYGSMETVVIEIYAASASNQGSTQFIGPDGMFRISDSDSHIERWYDPEADQMHYDIVGNAVMSDISVNVSYFTLNTKNYYLPINDIAVSIQPIDSERPGSMEVNTNVIFLPGSSIKVAEGGTLNIADGAIVMADKDLDTYSVTNKPPCRPAIYSPTRTGQRTWDDTKPAELNNNGTVIVAEGSALVATGDGANIYSESENGVYMISGSNTLSDELDCVTTSGTDITATAEIEPDPAVLIDDSADGFDTSSDSWYEGASAIYKMVEVDGKNVWKDIREVTYYDSDGVTPIDTLYKVDVKDKNNIHDFDDKVTAYAGFGDDGKYYKYVEDGAWNYAADPSDPVKLIATPSCVEADIFEKHSLTLEGYIDANFFLFDVPAGATVSYSWGEDADNGNAPFTATDTTFTNQDGYKKTSVSLAAKEINDDITVNLIYNNNVVASETYKASDYLYTVIGMNKSDLAAEIGKTQAKAAQLQTLCKATLDYCAKAQIQFGYHSDSLADSALSYSYDQVDTDGLSSYSIEGDSYDDLSYLSLSGQGYDYYGQSLTLESGTDYNIIFRNRTGMPLTATAVDAADDSVTYTVRRRVLNGAAVGTDGIGDYVTFDIRNIPAAKLSDDIVLTFAGGTTVTVNPATYMHAAMYTADYYQAQYPVYAERLRNVVAALYNYNQVAVDYFAD